MLKVNLVSRELKSQDALHRLEVHDQHPAAQGRVLKVGVNGADTAKRKDAYARECE